MTHTPAGPGQPNPHRPQPPGGYPTPGGWGPPGQPPPKKSRAGLWIGISAGALIIVGILVTGFIMGFALSGEDSGNAAGGSTSAKPTASPTGDTPSTSSTTAGAGDPNDSAQKFVDALNSGDDATAKDMYCSHSDPTPEATQAIAAESNLRVPARLDPTASYSVTTFLEGTIDGKQAAKPAVVLVDNGGSQWCVSSFVVSTS